MAAIRQDIRKAPPILDPTMMAIDTVDESAQNKALSCHIIGSI